MGHYIHIVILESVMVIKAPQPFKKDRPAVFLAGSIEMGVADNWQVRAEGALNDFLVLNPRRDDWDSSWVQSKDNSQFREQVEWELTAMDIADVILLHFERGTMSPISLLELGLYARHPGLIVHCPEGFWRKGNVDIVCDRYGIDQPGTMDEAIVAALYRLRLITATTHK